VRVREKYGDGAERLPQLGYTRALFLISFYTHIVLFSAASRLPVVFL